MISSAFCVTFLDSRLVLKSYLMNLMSSMHTSRPCRCLARSMALFSSFSRSIRSYSCFNSISYSSSGDSLTSSGSSLAAFALLRLALASPVASVVEAPYLPSGLPGALGNGRLGYFFPLAALIGRFLVATFAEPELAAAAAPSAIG